MKHFHNLKDGNEFYNLKSHGLKRKIISLEFPLDPFPVNFVSTNLKNSIFQGFC